MGTGWRRQGVALALGAIGVAMMVAGGLGVNEREARALVDCDVADYSNDGEEMAFLSLLNNYRSQNGQSALTVSQTLNRTAAWMVNDMGTNDYFSHTDSLGRSAYKRAVDCGYAGGAGENLAGGSEWDTAQEAFDAWKASPGHNANMLDGYYTEIGIARTNAPGSPYGWYWATEFGAGGGDPNPTPAPTNTATATKTPTKPPTAAPSTATPTPTPQAPASPSVTAAAPTSTPTKTVTATPTKTPSATPAGSNSPSTSTPTKTTQATSTPTRTPTLAPAASATPSPAPASLALRRGANLVAWPGDDTATAQALKSAGASVSMVYRWDPAAKKWQRYSPNLPGFANTLVTMRKGEAYWMISEGQAQVYVP